MGETPTAKQMIQRSNANGKPVSESMFLAFIDRIEKRIDEIEVSHSTRMDAMAQDVRKLLTYNAVLRDHDAEDERAKDRRAATAANTRVALGGAGVGAFFAWLVERLTT